MKRLQILPMAMFHLDFPNFRETLIQLKQALIMKRCCSNFHDDQTDMSKNCSIGNEFPRESR